MPVYESWLKNQFWKLTTEVSASVAAAAVPAAEDARDGNIAEAGSQCGSYSADAGQNRHDCGCKRYLDGEDAPFIRNVVNVDISTVCPDSLSSNRKPQAEARPVSTPPLAERLKRVPCAGGDAAALVFHLYQEVFLFVCSCSQQDAPASGCEFEGVVQKIHHRRCEYLWVCGDRPRQIAWLDHELEPPGLGVKPASHGEVIEERRHRDPLAPTRDVYGRRSRQDRRQPVGAVYVRKGTNNPGERTARPTQTLRL
jgi:hypothetical protein